jgi:hypothetical protein
MTTPRSPRFDDDFAEADAGDFAGEHDQTDLADDPPGGPERAAPGLSGHPARSATRSKHHAVQG